MKFQSKLTMALVAGLMAVGGVAQAQDMKFWRIGTGGAGGTYFPIGGLIANAISSPPGSRSCAKGGTCGVPGLVAIAVSTNASVANMNAIQAGQLDAGLAGAQSVTQGYEGTGKFVGNKKDKVRVIANLYPEDMHLVLKKGLKLNSLKDLNGKKIGVCGGCTYEAYMNKNLVIDAVGTPAFTYQVKAGELRSYETDVNAFDDLRVGDGKRLDAVLSALPTLKEAMKNGYPMKIVGKPVFFEPLSVAIDKGDAEFAAKIAEIVNAMRSDGTLGKLSMKWYGVDYSSVN